MKLLFSISLFVLSVSAQSDNIENCRTVLNNGKTRLCGMTSNPSICQNCLEQLGNGQTNAGIQRCKTDIPPIAPCFDFVRYTRQWSLNDIQSWGQTFGKLMNLREGPCNFLSKQERNLPSIVKMASAKATQAQNTLKTDPNIQKALNTFLKMGEMFRQVVFDSEEDMRPALTKAAEVSCNILAENGAVKEVQDICVSCLVYMLDKFIEKLRSIDYEALRRQVG